MPGELVRLDAADFGCARTGFCRYAGLARGAQGAKLLLAQLTSLLEHLGLTWAQAWVKRARRVPALQLQKLALVVKMGP